jgi:predicted protein tyrosine phosphatase
MIAGVLIAYAAARGVATAITSSSDDDSVAAYLAYLRREVYPPPYVVREVSAEEFRARLT